MFLVEQFWEICIEYFLRLFLKFIGFQIHIRQKWVCWLKKIVRATANQFILFVLLVDKNDENAFFFFKWRILYKEEATFWIWKGEVYLNMLTSFKGTQTTINIIHVYTMLHDVPIEKVGFCRNRSLLHTPVHMWKFQRCCCCIIKNVI